jgi:hypothetical protein
MDSTPGGQNNQNNDSKKPQLSWSQPITTPVTQKPVPPVQETKKPNAAASTSLHKSNTFRNSAIIVLLIAAVGIVASVIISQNKADTKSNSAPSLVASTTNPKAEGGETASSTDGNLSVYSPQEAGLHVAVARVVVANPTWVVVYENRGGLPGNVLGAHLFQVGQTSGSVDLLRGTLPGQTYFVGESRDDGDRMYSVANDPAIRDADGDPVWVQFTTK